jgi:hypothetical protein
VSPGPGLGSVAVDPGPAGGSGTPCPGDPREGYYAEVGVANGQGGPLSLVQTTMTAPSVVHPGDRLRFLVTILDAISPLLFGIPLTPTPTPLPAITFRPCPSYHEELEGVAGTYHGYRINCEQATPIASGAAETFEMLLDVPRDAVPGPAVIRWSMDGDGVVPPPARGYVEVRAPGG